jgi:hypothetical protein
MRGLTCPSVVALCLTAKFNLNRSQRVIQIQRTQHRPLGGGQDYSKGFGHSDLITFSERDRPAHRKPASPLGWQRAIGGQPRVSSLAGHARPAECHDWALLAARMTIRKALQTGAKPDSELFGEGCQPIRPVGVARWQRSGLRSSALDPGQRCRRQSLSQL